MRFNFFFSNHPLLRKIINHSSVLFSGQIIFTLFGIGSLIITARTLGAGDLGILTLIQTTVFLISAVLLPKPWLTIVKFGATLELNGRIKELKGLIRISFLTEFISAIIAGTFTLLFAQSILTLINVDQIYINLFQLYALTLYFNISGTSIGLLRHYDEVNWIRNIEISSGGVKLLLVIIGYLSNLGLGYFVISYAVAEIFKFTITNIIAYVISYKKKFINIPLKILLIKFKELKEIIKFGISMHFLDLLGTTRRELDLIVIGALLNPQFVGYYKVIKQFSRMFTLLGNPLKQAVYPDICKLWANNKVKLFIKILLQIIVILFIIFLGIAITFYFVADDLVNTLLGEDYFPIIGPLKLFVFISAIFISFQILNSAVLAKGLGGKAFFVEAFTNIIYFLILFLLVPMFQLYGIIYALCASATVWILMNGYFTFYDIKRLSYFHAE